MAESPEVDRETTRIDVTLEGGGLQQPPSITAQDIKDFLYYFRTVEKNLGSWLISHSGEPVINLPKMLNASDGVEKVYLWLKSLSESLSPSSE